MGESSAYLVYGMSFARGAVDLDGGDAGWDAMRKHNVTDLYQGGAHYSVPVFAIRETARTNHVNCIEDPKLITSLNVGEDWDDRLTKFCEDVSAVPVSGPGWLLLVDEDH